MGYHPKIIYCGNCDIAFYDSLMQDPHEVNFRTKHRPHNGFKSFDLAELCFGDDGSVAYKGTNHSGSYMIIKEKKGEVKVIGDEEFKSIEEQHTRRLMKSAQKHTI